MLRFVFRNGIPDLTLAKICSLSFVHESPYTSSPVQVFPIMRRVIAKPDMPISAPVNLIRHSAWKRAGKLLPGESQSRWQGAALGCQSFSLGFQFSRH